MKLGPEQLYARLSWHASERERCLAIEGLIADATSADLKHVARPPGRKDVWDGAAEALVRIGSPRVDACLPELLTWLQDMNWPGARTVFGFLTSMERNILVPHFEAAMNRAVVENDREWLEHLGNLAALRGDLGVLRDL